MYRRKPQPLLCLAQRAMYSYYKCGYMVMADQNWENGVWAEHISVNLAALKVPPHSPQTHTSNTDTHTPCSIVLCKL